MSSTGGATASDGEERARNMAAMEAIRDLLRVGDWPGLAGCWVDDGVMELPFALPGTPNRLDGIRAIAANQSAALELFSRFATPEFVIHQTIDPCVFFAEYASEAEVRATGRPYRNSYVGYFRFRSGKLVRWKEYFNPSVVREAFRP